MLQPVYQAIAARDAATAVSLAQSAVAAQPEQHEPLHALGLALHLAGDLEGAAVALDRAIAMAPHEASYHVARAALALGLGDPQRADAALSSAISSDPNRLSAYVFAAHLAMARGDREEAGKQVKLAKRVAPEHPVVLAVEGNLAELEGDHDRAVKLLSVAAQASPNDPVILSSLGLVYLKVGHHAFAEQTLRRALEFRPDVARLRWALVEALRRQDRHDELAPELERLLSQQPEDRRALALLGDCLLRQQRPNDALIAYRKLISLRPLHQPALDGVLEVLARAGMGAQGRELVEEQLAAEPGNDEIWQRRLAIAAGNEVQVDGVLARWRAALPDSAMMHGLCAQVLEARGLIESAEAEVDACLAQAPTLVGPLQVKLRALLRRDPAAALALAEKIVSDAQAASGKRLGLVWRGFALDRLGRCSEAAAAWRQAIEQAKPRGGQWPVPMALPAAVAEPAAGLSPRLLWGPPGSRVLELVGLLRRVPELAMLDDRFGPGPRPDGLWPPRADGRIVDAASWADFLGRRQIDPTRCLDWLPHWDGRTEAALPAAPLIAVLSDPRDLFLNALVFGGPQPWPTPPTSELASWLAQALTVLAERREQQPQHTLLVRADELRDAPVEAMARVAAWLGVGAPSVDGLEQSRVGLAGHPVCFAPGRWRDYADGFAAEFAQLAPVAARLGFA